MKHCKKQFNYVFYKINFRNSPAILNFMNLFLLPIVLFSGAKKIFPKSIGYFCKKEWIGTFNISLFYGEIIILQRGINTLIILFKNFNSRKKIKANDSSLGSKTYFTMLPAK